MKATEARHVFATLMSKARTGSLTEHDRRRLAQARQLLRRARRPAMNAGKTRKARRNAIAGGYRKIWFSSKAGTTAGLVLTEQSFKSTRSVEAFSRLFPHTEARYMARFHYSPVFQTWEEAFEYPTTKDRPSKNPSSRQRLLSGGIERIGRAEEVRYYRTIGAEPGYYKHAIKSKKAGVYTIPSGWVFVGSRSILITESKPRAQRRN
jgi:hypothetical protein